MARETPEPLRDVVEAEWVRDLPPLTPSLLGIAAGDKGEEDYKEYLWRKYGPHAQPAVTRHPSG